jgi:hypothetical protein
MNENVGFVTCPGCKMPWDDGQWACSYCGGTEVPAAHRAPGPAWMWWLIAAVFLIGAAIDLSLGGHVLHVVGGWLKAKS